MRRRSCRCLRPILPPTPDPLWRVYGPEYARIHSHGNLREVLPIIAETDWDAIDPIEPPPAEFERLVARALREGRGGRGFVLMPSSCPYGRNLARRTLENYRLMVELAESS